MAGRSSKQSSTPKRTTSTPVTGRRVKRLRTVKPTKVSGRPTAAKPRKSARPSATAKRRAIPPATRTKHRPSSTAQKSATFSLDAASAWSVAVAGSFNNWEPQAMTKAPDGVWRIMLQLAPGTYQYKFLVDTRWREDPNNPRTTADAHGEFNSICEVL